MVTIFIFDGVTLQTSLWRNKQLTLISKIAVIKALAASHLIYVLSPTTS